MESDEQPLNSPKLEFLYAYAAEETKAPATPIGGIPRQRLPGWIRWPIRTLLLPFVLIDLSVQRLARLFIAPPYKKAGECKKRGNCCFYILLPVKKGLLGWIHKFWSTEVLGFYLRDKTPYILEGKEVYVMGCRHLKKDGSCGHYALRPTVCRKWPLIEYFGQPRILKGCGFKAIPRHAGHRSEEERDLV